MDKTDIAAMILKRINGEIDSEIDIVATIKEQQQNLPETKDGKRRKYNTKKQMDYYARKNSNGKQYVNVFIDKDILTLINEDSEKTELSRSVILEQILYSHYENRLNNNNKDQEDELQ